MAIQTTVGSFSIIGANTTSPKVFWKGKELTEVTGIQVIFDLTPFVRLRVLKTTNFDIEYSEMSSQNIEVQKR